MSYPYTYTVDPTSDEPIMLIGSHIGIDDEDGPGVIGSVFARELLYLDTLGKKRIQVWINSTGGSVLDGYDIYNAILKTQTTVDTYACGLVASIAAVLFQAGRRRVMQEYSILMYHNPFSSTGTSDTKMLDSMRESLITMICSRSGMDKSAMARIMNRTTYIQPDEAKTLNLCDEIEYTADLNNRRRPSVMNSAKEYWAESKKIVNSLFDKKSIPKMSFKKVCNKLNLNEEASEDAIVSAIQSLEARAVKAEANVEALNKKSTDDLKAAQDKLTAAEAAVNKAKADYDAIKSKLDEVEQEKENAETAAKAEKAKNLISGFVAQGKISKEDAAEWEKDAVADFDKVKNRLEKLPVNRSAPKMIVNTIAKEDEFEKAVKGGAAADMARIQNRLQKV